MLWAKRARINWLQSNFGKTPRTEKIIECIAERPDADGQIVVRDTEESAGACAAGPEICLLQQVVCYVLAMYSEKYHPVTKTSVPLLLVCTSIFI